MRVMYSVGHLGDKFDRLPNRQRCVPDYFLELAAFNKLHAEVALAIALADLVDWDDAWMIKARRGFCFQTKALEVRLRGPLSKTDDF